MGNRYKVVSLKAGAEMHDLLQQEEESKQQLKELFEKLGYMM